MRPPNRVTEEPIQGPSPEPLFDTEAIRFGRFLDSDPPAREWVIDDVLPLGVTAVLASMGGVGKSYLTYQFGFSVTTGLPFVGMQMGDPGGFLYLAAEDDEAELHRRGVTLLGHFERAGEHVDRKALSDRLHVVSRVAEDNLLTKTAAHGEVDRTELVDRIVQSAIKIPDLRVIVLDPISRFRGGRANYEEDATRFVESLEVIREETGATVLGLAHVSQAGIKEGGGAEIIRGSTALVDGVRWAATLQPLGRAQAADYGVSEEDGVPLTVEGGGSGESPC